MFKKLAVGLFFIVVSTNSLSAFAGDGALPFGAWIGRGKVYDSQWNVTGIYTSHWIRVRTHSGSIHSTYQAIFSDGRTWSLDCTETVNGPHVVGTCDGGEVNRYFCADADFCKGTFEIPGDTRTVVGDFSRISDRQIRKSGVNVGQSGAEVFVIEVFEKQ